MITCSFAQIVPGDTLIQGINVVVRRVSWPFFVHSFNPIHRLSLPEFCILSTYFCTLIKLPSWRRTTRRLFGEVSIITSQSVSNISLLFSKVNLHQLKLSANHVFAIPFETCCSYFNLDFQIYLLYSIVRVPSGWNAPMDKSDVARRSPSSQTMYICISLHPSRFVLTTSSYSELC